MCVPVHTVAAAEEPPPSGVVTPQQGTGSWQKGPGLSPAPASSFLFTTLLRHRAALKRGWGAGFSAEALWVQRKKRLKKEGERTGWEMEVGNKDREGGLEGDRQTEVGSDWLEAGGSQAGSETSRREAAQCHPGQASARATASQQSSWWKERTEGIIRSGDPGRAGP